MKKLVTLLLTLAMLVTSFSCVAETTYPLHYDEPITITSVRTAVSSTAVFTGENKDYTDNVWTRALKERYNINTEYLWVVDSTEYNTKLNMMLVSGDMPDYIRCDATTLAQLIDNDMVMDVTELLANAPERVKKYCGNLTSTAYASASKNGEGLYGIPYSTAGSLVTTYIRKDWLDKLGLSVPTTFEEVINVARAFALQDPDGNGEQDTVGFYIDGTIYTGAGMSGMLNAFHVYPEYYLDNGSGVLEYGTIAPEMKTALSYLHGLYEEGVIHPEFGTLKSKTMIAEGKQGILFSYYSVPLTQLQPIMDSDPEADWICVPMMSIDDQPLYINNANTNSYTYIAISKDCQHPEAVLQMMEMYAELFLEASDVETFNTYVNDENGNEVWNCCSPLARVDYANRSRNLQKMVAGLLNGTMTEADVTTEAVSVAQRVQKYLDGDRSLWAWYMIYKDEGPLYWENYYVENNMLIDNCFVAAPTETQSSNSATLTKLLQEGFTQIIKGEKDIDYFDELVAQWHALGGDDILAEVNAWYALNK